MVTCDGSDNKEIRVTTRGRTSKKGLEKVFEGRPGDVETPCIDTHRSYAAFAKSNNMNHQEFNAPKGQRVKNKICHVQNANNTAARLRTWMRPFNGVATKYLQNHMNWFMILERIKYDNQQLKEFACYALAGQAAWGLWRIGSNSVIY